MSFPITSKLASVPILDRGRSYTGTLKDNNLLPVFDLMISLLRAFPLLSVPSHGGHIHTDVRKMAYSKDLLF